MLINPTASTLIRYSTSGSPNQSYSFGTREATRLAPISAPFTFRNTTTQPLTITELRPSCGCTAALLVPTVKLPLTLQSGASLQITVNIDSSHLTAGSIDKSVSIYAARHAGPIAILHVIGTILPPVAFSPSSLDFGNPAAAQLKSLSLSVVYDDSLSADGSSVSLVSSDPSITIDAAGPPQPAPVIPAWSAGAGHTRHLYTYTVHFNPGHSIGNLFGRVTAVWHAKAGSEQDVELGDISYFANVAGDIRAIPTVLAFGMVTPGKPATQTILIQGKNLDKITTASSVSYLSVKLGAMRYNPGLSHPFGAVSPQSKSGENDPDNESVQAEVTLGPLAPVGALQAKVTITTGGGQVLALPVYATIGASK